MKQGWEIKKLGEVCDIQGGSTPKRTESSFWDNGTYPWFTIEDIREQGHIITDTKQKITKIAWEKMRIFPKDTILLCCTASLGEYAITQIPLSSNQQFNGLMIKDKSYLSPMYLMHYCATLKKTLLSLSGKATIDFVSAEKVRQITIPIPPFEEQERIVEELDCLSGVIEKKREQLRELDALAESIFYTMFGDSSQSEYKVKRLAELSNAKLSYGSGASAIEYDGETRYVRITDIKEDGELNDDKASPSVIDDKYLLNEGDILFARSGATVGKTYHYKEKDGRAIYAGYLIRFIPNTQVVLPSYIFRYTKTAYYRAFIQSSAQAVAQPNINAQQYGALMVPVPPLTLQQEFADKIEAIEKQKELIKQSIKETEDLFNERMNHYFN